MKSLFKKIVCGFMMTSLIMTNSTVSAVAGQFAQKADSSEVTVSDNYVDGLGEYIASGTESTVLSDGKKSEMTWRIYENGDLYITGSGQPTLIRNGLDTENRTISIKKLWPWSTYASSIKKVYANVSDLSDTSYMFAGLSYAEEFDLSLDTKNVKNMAAMFYNCKNAKKIEGLSSFATSKVTNMSMMFSGCSNLGMLTGSQNYSMSISTWNLSKVEDMSRMFENCTNIYGINFANNVDTSSVRSMYKLFAGCTGLEYVSGINNFNTSNLQDMEGMFYGCKKISVLDLSNFDTSEVRNMKGAFDYCDLLQSIDISSFSFESLHMDNSSIVAWDLFTNSTNLECIKCPQDTSEKINLPSNGVWLDSGNQPVGVYIGGVTKPNGAPYVIYSAKAGAGAVSGPANVEVNATKGGTVSPSPLIQYDDTCSVNFYITPDEGFDLSDVKFDGKDVLYTVKIVDHGKKVPTYLLQINKLVNTTSKDHVLSVKFAEANEYKIETTNGSNGVMKHDDGTKTALYDSVRAGNTMKYIFIPDEGYAISQVMVDGKDIGPVSEYEFTDINRSHSIKVTYVEGVIIDVSALNEEGEAKNPYGTITNEGVHYYLPRASFTFKITPKNEYFGVSQYWVDGRLNGFSLNEFSYTFRADEMICDHTFSAQFVKLCGIKSSAGEHGQITTEESITCKSISDNYMLIMPGYNQKYKIVPENGYAIEKIMVDGKEIPKALEYEFSKITMDHNIEVTFEKCAFVVYFDANGGKVDIESKGVTYGNKYGTLPIPIADETKRGMEFIGWYTEKEGGEQVTADSIFALRTDITLYAHYQKLSMAVGQKYDVSIFFKDVKDKKKYSIERVSGKGSVTKKGMVKATKPGIIKVIPWSKVGKKSVPQKDAAMEIEITKPAFTTKKTEIKLGETINLSEMVTGLPAANMNTFQYSVPKKKSPVAKINPDTGELTPVKKGKVKVTLSIKNRSGYTSKAYITVKVKP